MNQELLHTSIIDSAQFVFSRSGGKGGQNVNKVNTKVQIFVPLSQLKGLSEQEIELVRFRLKGILNGEGDLSIAVQEERTQERNRAIALDRLESQIVNAARIQRKRYKTKPTQASQEKRLLGKKLKSQIKQLRKIEY